MKKVVLPLLAAFLSLFIILLLPKTKVSADVGEIPMPGGVITSGDTTDSIEMTEENVLFDINNATSDCPFFGYDDCWYAHVTADFTMTNLTAADVNMNLMFPFPTNYAQFDPEYYNPDFDPARSFVVTSNGSNVDFTKQSFDYNYEGETTSLPSIAFPITFAAEDTTDISIEYDIRLVMEPKSIYGTFLYIMETGSNWAGNIGEGTITFQFPVNLSPEFLGTLSRRFEMSNNQLIWHFTNLEPTAADNLQVTFAPSLITEMDEQPEEYASVSSNNAPELTIPGSEMWDFYPEGYYGLNYLYSSPLYLSKQELPNEIDDASSGEWFADLTETPTPWIRFNLGGIYEISSISVFPGIKITLMNDAGDIHDSYDLLNRPKQLRLTFSDGSTQTVDVPDVPDALAEIAIEPVETYTVQVDIIDTYPGLQNADSYVGISRLYLELGEKLHGLDEVAETEQTTTTEAQPTFTLSAIFSNATYLAVAGIGLFLIVLGIVIGILIMKNRKAEVQTAPKTPAATSSGKTKKQK